MPQSPAQVVADPSAHAALADGAAALLAVDANRILFTRQDGGLPPFPAFPNRLQFSTEELEDVETVIDASPGILVQCTGFNDLGVTAYAQLYDTAAEPTGADLPIQSMKLTAGAAFGWSPGNWLLENGLWVALSTTPVGYTSAGEGLWCNVLAWVP